MKLYLAAALLLGGCASESPLPPRADSPRFDPVAFFAGRSEGKGTLDVLMSPTVPIRAVSRGRSQPGGGLILDQLIREGTKPARKRRWNLRRVGPGQWVGSLDDAQGKVSVRSKGNSLDIAYTMNNGLAVEQQLRLRDDGRTAVNRMSVRKWGITVATVDELIRKLD